MSDARSQPCSRDEVQSKRRRGARPSRNDDNFGKNIELSRDEEKLDAEEPISLAEEIAGEVGASPELGSIPGSPHQSSTESVILDLIRNPFFCVLADLLVGAYWAPRCG